MTGKNIFLILSSLLFTASVYLFLNRTDIRAPILELQNQPKIRIYQYEFYRTKDDIETSRMVGKKADLMEGGLLLLRDGARGSRVRENRREEVDAESADILLSGSSPGQLAGEIRIKSAKVFQKAEEDGLIQTRKEVHIHQGEQDVVGLGGFEYAVVKQSIKLKGGVSGTILPKEIREQQKMGKKE
ncbi:MAG: hypothetical protein NTV34_00525 [Proteobacteria bacterium]|nr:hypothetical protein [Pseudomonadota bacterium]